MLRATLPALHMKTEPNATSLNDDGLASFGGVEDCGKLLSGLSSAEPLQSNVQCTTREIAAQPGQPFSTKVVSRSDSKVLLRGAAGIVVLSHLVAMVPQNVTVFGGLNELVGVFLQQEALADQIARGAANSPDKAVVIVVPLLER